MSVTPTRLRKRASGELVPAELHTKLDLADLLDAESAWTPWRFRLIKQLHQAAVPRTQWPQHWHWNWVHKLLSQGVLDIGGALSPLRLLGVKCEDEWQGLVLGTSLGHQSRVAKGGMDLLYLKYLESAPWNLTVREVGQEPRYSGVGRQLMELGVRLSEAMDFRGRMGLHALPQSDGFYEHCGMTDLGEDPRVQGLRYFEMTEEQARAFLNPGRTNR